MTAPVAKAAPTGLWQGRRRLAVLEPSYLLLLVTVAVCLVRAPDQPSVTFDAATTTLTVTPADVLLFVLLVTVAVRAARTRRLPSGGRAGVAAVLAFAAWLGLTSLANGADAAVAAGKLVELAVLSVAVWMLLDRAEKLVPLLVVIVGMTVAAAVPAVIGGLNDPGRRQESFIGEHDLALLGTLALCVAFAALVAGRGELGRLPLVAGVFGAAGVTFGASFAGLLGVYLAAGAVLVAAAARHSLRPRAAAWILLVCAAITAGTLMLRSDNLGFLYEWFGETESSEAGAHAGSWSSRLIYAYVGGRIFLDNPALGTGWHGELPPEEYARYLPDAHARFPDQPPHYFPPADGTFIPQQTYDQVLYELGVVGAVLLLLLGALTVRYAVSAARRHPRGGGREYAAYLPLAWLLAAVGALAGSALFGGTPLAALFWLTIGVALAGPALAAEAVETSPSATATTSREP